MSAEAASPFIDKWLGREPEMTIAETFCAPAHKDRFLAWGALLHELRASLFELGEPRVGEVKTSWWAEELAGLANGQRRHPLGEVLAGTDAPWSSLSRNLLELRASQSRAADTSHAIAALLPLALAATDVEAALFEAQGGPAQARSLARHWLLHRLPQGLGQDDQARLPMHLLARHGVTAAQLPTEAGLPLLRDWAGELARVERGDLRKAAYIRRVRDRFDQVRLDRLASGKGFAEPPPLGNLWRAWRVARGAR